MAYSDLPLKCLVEREATPMPWTEGDTIPWDEPAFSQRMLQEHLSQNHDWASRRAVLIDAHVAWLHTEFLTGEPRKILDLGCGPGLYTDRLAALGHHCVGMDHSPASIDYATRQAASAGQSITYQEDDIRTASFGSGYDLVLMAFGELNVFAETTARDIVTRAADALSPSGVLVVEVHHEAAVRQIATQPATWASHRQGLFSGAPHLLLQECFWDEPSRAATRRYFVVDLATGTVTRHAASYQAYTDEAYRALLNDCGLDAIREVPSLRGTAPERDSPCANLKVFVARRS